MTTVGWIYIFHEYLREGSITQVCKWGNSLAIRLPSAIVEALKLKEGDEIDIRVAGERAFDVARDRSRERPIERIKALSKPLPPAEQYGYRMLNSLIIASALQARSRTLWSEDMQHGIVIRGRLRIANPFRKES